MWGEDWGRGQGLTPYRLFFVLQHLQNPHVGRILSHLLLAFPLFLHSPPGHLVVDFLRSALGPRALRFHPGAYGNVPSMARQQATWKGALRPQFLLPDPAPLPSPVEADA